MEEEGRVMDSHFDSKTSSDKRRGSFKRGKEAEKFKHPSRRQQAKIWE
jgi:hypothetical protein